MSDKGRLVYFNGQMVPEKEARISIYDSALMFGDMVFEMTRSFNGKQFMLKEHLVRLYNGLKILRVPMTMTMDEMERAVYDTIEANTPSFNPDDEHRVMIDVTRGLLGLYQNNVDIPVGTNVIIADFPLRWTVQSMSHLYDEGINAIVPSQRAIPGWLLDPKIKNRSRIHYLMGNIEVSLTEGKNNWALLLDPDGYVAEGTGNNFFIIKDGALITPEPRNILRGISREYVMTTLATKLGMPVYERNFEIYDVYTADEAFMTSTPFCMLPVIKVNGANIGTGQIGPTYKKLLSLWSELVGVDIPGQIKAWASRNSASGDAPTAYRFKPK
jgi:branched-chain amino acid aminotransferase